MASPNRPARLNRTLLVVLGLVLLLGGVAVALFGTGVLSRLVPGLDPSAPVFTSPPAPPTWAAYVAIVAAVVIGLLCLRWLLAQTLRTPKTGSWTLLPARPDQQADRSGPGGSTVIASDRAADAVVADISGYPGISRASAYLTGTPSRPTLQLDVTATADASATELRRQIHDHALPRLRDALDLDGLSARMVLRMNSSAPSRTR